MTIQTHKRTCSLCEATCGIEIEFNPATEEILSIKGDKDDPFSQGYICPKATALQDLHEDPDRVTTPMLKTESGWQPIGWTQALDIAAKRFAEIQAKHGKDAIGSYLGNPNVHNYGNLLFGPLLLRALGSKNKFSATSVDQLPHHMASLHMLGHQLLLPIPDIDRTDFMIIMGANPLASNGSLMTAPDFRGRIRAIQKRGGRVLVIDPRRTETAKVADEHWFIRPGQDLVLLLAILNIWTHEQRDELPTLPDYVDSIDLASLCAGFTPDIAAKATGIDESNIRQLAKQWLAAPSAVCYARMGLSVQQYGGLCQWLVNVLNIASGNFDRPGGVMFTKPAIDLPAILAARGGRGHFDKYRSRVRKLPEFGGEFPVAVMAEEILTEGQGQIRGMLTVAGNPIISTPNSDQLNRAFESLDFMVSIDYFINETTRHADLVLPPCGPLERDHYDLIFNTFAVRNVAKYAPALFDKPKGGKEDWEILLGLAKRLNRGSLKTRLQTSLTYAVMNWLKPVGILKALLKRGPYQLALKTLIETPEGLDLGALEPSMPNRLFTKNKKLSLTPKVFVDELQRLRTALLAPQSDDSLLIGRRHVRSNNSWLHNSRRLTKGPRRDRLLLNPVDAERLGIAEGDTVKVTSRVATLTVQAEPCDSMMLGVVSLPHGWGHDEDGVQLAQARQAGGVNTNRLTDDHYLDELTGNAALNGVSVTITRVA
ncbi:molybdopterin-dependent oxidoreductase [Thalassolituus oleivorans]|uniref:molybdopterin-dependent oxidoreductase n=1 Tax=Thalassolituus oleivorans TaxID=187493 RepID=UPI00042DBB79|nr:molybdopterin-dependent oxidoreductase [Thalassolituus oleivorans]AHK15733.1 dehydrogenase [Thalassolituus oleivorans R6-15]